MKDTVFQQLLKPITKKLVKECTERQKIGIRTKVKRSTLSDANRKRPAECFLWILEQLMLVLPRKKHKEIKQVTRILDSSPIHMYLTKVTMIIIGGGVFIKSRLILLQ